MKPGWYRAPTGQPQSWFWDGKGWLVPVSVIEQHVTEAIIPHLERTYREGFTAGVNSAVHAAKRLLEEA